MGATGKENIHIEKCLMDWKYEVTPLKENESGIVAAIPKSTNLMLVFARKKPKDTIVVCEQLRKDAEGSEAPILLVKGRYKMSHIYELRRCMENISHIITPFSQEEIRTKIDEVLGST